MKKLLWNALSAIAGIAAAAGMRRVVATLWPGSAEPPLNPADRRISWKTGLGWALASGAGAGVARLVSRRAAAAAWEKTVDQVPPGIAEPA